MASAPASSAARADHQGIPNGAALAAVLAAGVGSFAMGLFVVLNEAGLFAAPALYAPAGGLSGRAILACVTWLIAWAILHARWKSRQVESRAVLLATLVLTGLGLLGTFPPLWELF